MDTVSRLLIQAMRSGECITGAKCTVRIRPAPQRSALSQDLGENLRLTAHNGFIAGIDPLLVLVRSTCPHPNAKVTGVFIQ